MWSSITADYAMSATDESGAAAELSLTLPTTEQQALMDQTYQADGIIDSNTPATVGMYGYTDSTSGDAEYWFYFNFKQAELYSDYVVAKTLRVIFQMGNGSSDWEGVRWYYDTLAYSSADTYYKLLPCSIANSNLSSIDDYERDNSDFTGFIQPTTGYITILR